MKADDLKSKLAAQRKWREAKPQQTFTSRGERRVIVIVLLLIAIAVNLWFFSRRITDGENVTPTGYFTGTATAVTETSTGTPAPIIMTVCAENLHVRFTPNGDVRGYLKQGEQVTLALNEHGHPITKSQDNENWILIAAPVAGWANTKFLCNPKEHNHD